MNKLIVLLALLVNTCVAAAVLPIVPNTSVEEQVSNGTEKVYSVTLKQGEGITFNLTPNLNTGSVSYYLYDNEQLRSYSYIKNNSVSSGNSALDFKAAATGTYYLQVKSSGNGSYKMDVLKAWFNEGASDSDRAFHGSAYSAWAFSNGTYSSTVSGRYWYRFNVAAGMKAQIDITPNLNSGIFSATIYDGIPDSSGKWTSLVSVNPCCTTINGVTKTLSFTPAIGGTFYLETYQASGGTLTLNASGIAVGAFQPTPSTTTPTTPTSCPAAEQPAATTYTAGILKIPEVQVSDGLGGTLKYNVELEVVPLSNPVTFKIRNATPK